MRKSEKELRSRDAARNIGQELLQAAREMKAGRRELLARLRIYRGRLPADFKFDRLEYVRQHLLRRRRDHHS